jgi:uncharacterized membrane protein
MSFFRKKQPLLSETENEKVVQAIREAEQRTSGEIRVFVESKNPLVNPLERAAIIFDRLEMEKTRHRNAVLIYIASHHHELAVYGDEGIHQQVGSDYWQEEVKQMLSYFRKGNIAEGLLGCIKHIGETLHEKFPYIATEDKNELPDEIIFGK